VDGCVQEWSRCTTQPSRWRFRLEFAVASVTLLASARGSRRELTRWSSSDDPGHSRYVTRNIPFNPFLMYRML